ncbi:MAG TPA: ABC transporter ATP-binding protein [Acidobacteriaceae bacterium]|nr:ABC transporter ATP-binding protein [Acidobacteriaceae bacterium]
MKKCDELLCAFGLRKTYPSVAPGTPDLELFHDLNLQVEAGEMVAIIGESGAGKSTLLHILAALDEPTAGEVWCGFTHVTGLSKAEASAFRNREIGYVWQFHYLLPEFSAVENVALPLLARGVARPDAMQQAAAWLERVGLSGRAANRSGELSGGEQQRVSIARALVTQPKVLLADEPTGDLDAGTADRVFGLVQQLHHEHGLTSVIVTHNTEFARRCDRVLRLAEGHLVSV